MADLMKYNVEKNLDTTKTQLIGILSKEIKKPYITTSWNNYELTIKIEKAGTSEIKFMLKGQGENSTIEETKRSIAFMHKPFIGEVEKTVNDLLVNKLGARKA